MQQPDVVFLDIAMPGLDGLRVAQRFGEPDGGPLVVFVTAYDEHALAAFRVHAADYVLKPLDRERLRDAVEHARRTLHRRRHPNAPRRTAAPRLAIRDGRGGHFVPMADVLWLESFGNYARVYTTNARYIHRATMAHLSRAARAARLRAHPSHGHRERGARRSPQAGRERRVRGDARHGGAAAREPDVRAALDALWGVGRAG